MRLLSLDLERYGPFTDRQLVFPRDAKLCVVIGENEAGKSCSLAAITDLLFGIENRTRYDFLHEGSAMRVGAAIETRDGRQLTFKRRKGNKNVLLDEAGQSIGDDALAPFLGGLSRNVFCSAFGLTKEALRAGGEEMTKNDGELGATLFAAASGLRGLTDLRAQFDREADSIFTPNASKERRFYQALARYDDSRRAIRESEVRAGDWKGLNDRIEALGGSLRELKDQRAGKASESARLSRLKRIAPLVRQIDMDLERVQDLGTLPDVAPGFAARLRSHLNEVATSAHGLALAKNATEAAQRELAQISVDAPMLEAAGRVLELFAGLGAFRNDRRDLPRIRAEVEDFEGELRSLATRLGLGPHTSVADRQPADAALALVQSLASNFRAIAETQETNARLLRSEVESLADLKKTQAGHGELRDPRPLRDALVGLEPVLKQLGKRRDVELSVETETRALKEEASRLRPPVPDLDALARAPLPGQAAITGFQNEKLAAEEALRLEQQRAADASGLIEEISARLATLAMAGPVPTPEAIAEVRGLRAVEWTRLRATLFQAPQALAGSDLAQSVVRFEGHTDRADHLADEAVSSAEQVASHASDTRQLRDAGDKLQALHDAIQERELKRAALQQEWSALWSGTQIAPGMPAEMSGWLTSASALLARRDKLEIERALLASIDRDVGEIEPRLRELGTKAGLSEAGSLPVELLVHGLRDRIQVLGAEWENTRGLEASIEDALGRVSKLEGEASKLSERHRAWSAQWKPAVQAIGFDTATPEQAEAALIAWREAPVIIRERENRERRVAGMERDTAHFETQAAALASALAPDLASQPAEQLAEELNTRLLAARQAETLRTEGVRRVNDLVRVQEDAERSAKAADKARDALIADLPNDTDLEALCDCLAGREALFASLGERRSNLVSVGDGIGEEDLRAELIAFQPDAVEAELQQLAADASELDRQFNETFAEHNRAVHEREALETGVGAEVALQQRRNAEAELAAATRDWAVLKIGALYLSAAVERRREGQHDPLVTRAGELFETLTGGSFVGLGQDFDSNDVPHLIGVKPSGERKNTSVMSEGARDQLYLALRLAYLEDYAERSEPAPFIGDDIFASSDARRTARGLKALAAIGDRVQPILFTHHDYVVDIARKELGSDVAIIELA